MNLEKAIKEVKKIKEIFEHLKWHGWINDIKRDVDTNNAIESIDTVLKALDERYNKGYQDGFKQAKFDCEMDKLDGR
jgi:hypothetical protein